MRIFTLVILSLALMILTWPVSSAVKGDAVKGKEVYDSFCWVCHGKYGRGDGPAGRNLKVRPRNLTDFKYMSKRTDEQLFQWISGRNPNFRIPAHAAIWREIFTDEAVRDVIAYIRTLSSPTAKGSALAGQDLFNIYCWVCHGRGGRGDGPAAANLPIRPRDLTEREFRARMTDDELFSSISTGAHQSTYMPIWGTSLKRQEIWDLVEYIKTLPGSQEAGKQS